MNNAFSYHAEAWTFSNLFNWMKLIVLWYKFSRSLLLRVKLITINGSGNGLALNRWQAIIGTKEPKLWCYTAIMNYVNPVYGVATICHQVRWLCWGHPSLFHTATSRLIWYKMFCLRDISYTLIWMEFINMFSVYAQSGTHSRFNWWIIVVLTYNPSVLMCVEITNAPKI